MFFNSCGVPLADFEYTLGLHMEILDIMGPSHPKYSESLLDLSKTMLLRFQCLRNMADLDQAIYYNNQATTWATGEENRPELLYNLSASLFARFHELG